MRRHHERLNELWLERHPEWTGRHNRLVKKWNMLPDKAGDFTADAKTGASPGEVPARARDFDREGQNGNEQIGRHGRQ